jgi:hypothetical protein
VERGERVQVFVGFGRECLEWEVPPSSLDELGRTQEHDFPRVVRWVDSTLGAVRLSFLSSFPPFQSLTIFPSYSYIPLKVDYTDLFDIMAFFAGDLDGKNAHDDLAKKIADNGKDYAQRFWRYADMEACKSLPVLSLSASLHS